MAQKKAKKATKKDSKGKIQPLADRVLIREEEAKQTKTTSGIFIPESVDADKSTKKGVVVAIGDGKFEDGKIIPMKVKIGDTVVYSWGDKVEIDGEKYVIVRESEISAILN
ncbi:MAG: co-chaperone GroES [Candidatus Pacebacteria bacterium]|nr:co-chaperone GroES [Candidatus Paceibacterota bacterium]MDD5356990.1 co-chaperone GroES [Candidatus Paceibacterota bacterium]